MDAKIENSKSHSYIEDDDVLIVQLSTNDFSKGIIAAVNHSGDSDSTGAVNRIRELYWDEHYCPLLW